MKFLLLSLCLPAILIPVSNDRLVKSYERFAKKMAGYEYVSNEADPQASFLMSTSEITNLDYLEFLYETRKAKGEEAYLQMLPDTSLWQDFPIYGGTLEIVYHDHPGYHYFPVVNISYKQARSYCGWLQEVLNRTEWLTGYQLEVKLPSIAEWTYAATSGGNPDNLLPWSEANLGTPNEPRAFYTQINPFAVRRAADGELMIHENFNSNSEQSGAFLGDVHQLETGFWGLAHMAGNAAEFVEEKGYTKGGSWRDPAYYLLNDVSQRYEGTGASPSNGFRVLVKLVPDQVN